MLFHDQDKSMTLVNLKQRGGSPKPWAKGLITNKWMNEEIQRNNINKPP